MISAPAKSSSVKRYSYTRVRRSPSSRSYAVESSRKADSSPPAARTPAPPATPSPTYHHRGRRPGKEAESGKTNFMTSANGNRKGLLYRRGRQVVLRGMKFHGYRLGCPVHITITGCANIIDMFSLSALFLLRCRPLVATRNERRRTQHRPQQTPISSRSHNALFLIHCFSIKRAGVMCSTPYRR